MLDAETERHGALCTPGNPITCAVRTSPQAPRGGVHSFFPSAMPHRYSTVARLDLAAIRPRPPDLDGHPTLRLWLMIAGSIGHSAVGCGGDRVAGAVGSKSARRSRNTCRSSPKHLPVSPTPSMPLRRTAALDRARA